MKKNFAFFLCLLLILYGCEKTETIQFDLEGTIKGQVAVIYEDTDASESDSNLYEDVEVILDDGDNKLSATVDINGEYSLENIPIGTYNLIFSKPGFSEFQNQGVQIIGGDEPIYCFGYLFEKSSTTIENLELELDEYNNVYLKGTVNNTSSSSSIWYFIHDDSNVSYTNYTDYGQTFYDLDSGSGAYLGIDSTLFPSGTKIYVRAYACSYGYIIGYLDILSNHPIWPVGEPSNIASITIP